MLKSWAHLENEQTAEITDQDQQLVVSKDGAKVKRVRIKEDPSDDEPAQVFQITADVHNPDPSKFSQISVQNLTENCPEIDAHDFDKIVQLPDIQDSNRDLNVSNSDKTIPEAEIIDVEKKEPESDNIGATEERDFFQLNLGGEIIHALCDQGSQISLIKGKIADKFKNRVKPHTSLSVGPFGNETERITGVLPVCFNVNGQSETFDLRVSPTLSYDAILGKDFLKKYDIDVRNGRGLWRSKEGAWSKFWTPGADQGTTILAESAGLAEVTPDQRSIIDDLVATELAGQVGKKLGKTSVLTHRVTLLPGATPVKHARRRMSPAIREIAIAEVKRMLDEDIIEPSNGA